MDYFFLLRPTYYFNIWLLFCAGMYVLQFSHSPENIWGLTLSSKTIFLISGITLFCSGCFINWQLTSKSNFKLQDKVSLINTKIDESKSKIVQYALLSIGSILILISNFMVLPIIFLLIYFCTSIFNKHNNEPHIGNLITLSLFVFSMGIVHQYTTAGKVIDFSDIIQIIPYILLIIIIAYLHQQGRDSKYSRFKLINIMSLFFCIISCLFGISINDPITSTASLTIIPFLIMNLIRNSEIDLLRSIRYSILIMAVFLFSVYPQFIWISIILYFLSKYYYWHRFDFHYPKLVLENDRNYTK
jgi:hypothetical protein